MRLSRLRGVTLLGERGHLGSSLWEPGNVSVSGADSRCSHLPVRRTVDYPNEASGELYPKT